MIQVNGREIFQKKRADKELSGEPETGIQAFGKPDATDGTEKALTANVTTEEHGKRGLRLAGPERVLSDGTL